MEEVKREVRTAVGGHYAPRLREVVDEANNVASRVIEGYAIVFGVESRMLCDYWDDYREIIERGAVTEEQLAGWDIKMTMYHNREKLLARSNKGEGTLRLSVDEVGVKYEFEAPNTADGDTALELVKRGDLGGSSFTYWSDEQDSVRYEKTDDGVLLRHVNRVDWCGEMTIAADPAYIQTTVTAREVTAAGIVLRDDTQGEPKRENEDIKKWRELTKKSVY